MCIVLRQGNYITTRLGRVGRRVKVAAVERDLLMRVLKRPGLHEGGKTEADEISSSQFQCTERLTKFETNFKISYNLLHCVALYYEDLVNLLERNVGWLNH